MCLFFHHSVGGGELFDRIIDENYTLMELDAVVFIRQICDGLQYMHKMSILHLDLKVTKNKNDDQVYGKCYNFRGRLHSNLFFRTK